jgi:hypothetical protein
MNSEDRDLILSPAADQIQNYCYELAHQLGLELEYVYLGVDKAPPCTDARYKLTVKGGPGGLRWFWFTRDKITGYSTGTSTTTVQNEIRKNLETCLDAARQRSALASEKDLFGSEYDRNSKLG